MKYDHNVYHNGIFYHTGSEVPIDNEIAQSKNQSNKPNNTMENQEKKFSKSEIARMSTSELQNLAASQGIENAYNTSGSELKKILVEFFGL